MRIIALLCILVATALAQTGASQVSYRRNLTGPQTNVQAALDSISPGGGAANLSLNGVAGATGITTINFTQAAGCSSGVTQALSQSSTTGNIQTNVDPNCVATNAAIQANTHLAVTTTSSSGTTFTGTMNPTLTSYTVGMVVWFTPNASLSGSPTLNIDTLGAKAMVQTDGSTAATSSDVPSGHTTPLWYDGTRFRLIIPSGFSGTCTVNPTVVNGVITSC